MITRTSSAVALAVVLAAGCTTAQPLATTVPAASIPTMTAPLRPLVVGWERYFGLDWAPAQRAGAAVLRGRIVNGWGLTATNVRLLVDALDAAGRVVGQRVAWLGAELTPGTTARFEIPVGQPAAAYRLSVLAFDWVQTGEGEQR